ncbi:MAG: DUF3027 domain-containing protein [Bifidobacterium sp.]|jgi:hypothetical protein|nr:DUF3027 domain-containing protein [Bifidobacterium sp.]MCH4175334.1 DUF3027 domain-containing protein [Bifidobacterium sp.]
MSEKLSDPQELAKSVALEVAATAEEVGDFVTALDEENNITDFRFVSHVRGYENWQWSVTLFHDVEFDKWTVNESSLIPAQGALLPPAWIPWKDRLLPEDLSVTDAMGTEADDPRIEPGIDEQELRRAEQHANAESETPSDDITQEESNDTDSQSDSSNPDSAEYARNAEDFADAAIAFHLTRNHVMTAEGRAETAKRWYAGQHGPKSLSTKTADGLTCEECGFLIPLQGELGRLFGVCANKWSPDDGKVVSLDHGCGEHSEIEAAEGSQLWVQSEPAYDDLHIDVERHHTIKTVDMDNLSSQSSEPASDAELPEVEILESQQINAEESSMPAEEADVEDQDDAAAERDTADERDTAGKKVVRRRRKTTSSTTEATKKHSNTRKRKASRDDNPVQNEVTADE